METISETSDAPDLPESERGKKKEVELTYQGRKTARAGSEQRRRDILEAALRIVVRDGVRGVRHRAVATEARVPLSATTYYFKDISDLITDTFTLFVDMGVAKYHGLLEEHQDALSTAMAEIRSEPGSRKAVIDKIVKVLVSHIHKQLSEQRDYLLAEQAFKLECLRNDNLKAIAEQHTEFLLQDLHQFFSMIGSKAPRVDGILMMQIISAAEYHGLMKPIGEFDREWTAALFFRGMQHMLTSLQEDPLELT